jgi:tRNA threonylcarbamoyladenosine modification (KEOPS) complex  Pcc1 subunit
VGIYACIDPSETTAHVVEQAVKKTATQAKQKRSKVLIRSFRNKFTPNITTTHNQKKTFSI